MLLTVTVYMVSTAIVVRARQSLMAVVTIHVQASEVNATDA